jgi:hypothetical protein
MYKIKKYWIYQILLLSVLPITSKAQDSLDLDRKYFCGQVTMVGDSIKKFKRKLFSNPDFYIPVEYRDFATFDSCVFVDFPFFDSVYFDKSAKFAGSIFGSRVEFLGAHFKDYADFTIADFRRDVDFTGARFDNPVDFSGSTFNMNGDFSDVVFKNTVYLRSLVLSPETQLYFWNTTLPDTLDFSYNEKTFHEIDLTVANLYDKTTDTCKIHFIQFYKTDVSKFHLDYSHFRLLFPKRVQSSDNTQDSITLSDDDKESVYEGLLKNFRDHGQNESYQKLDVEYHYFKAQKHWFTLLLFYLNCVWWYFGYHRELIFVWTLVFIFIFTTSNYFWLDNLNTNVYTQTGVPQGKELPGGYRKYWYSLVYTSVIFLKLTLDLSNFKFQHIRGTLYIVLIYSLGLLCLAYMANFIIQK